MANQIGGTHHPLPLVCFLQSAVLTAAEDITMGLWVNLAQLVFLVRRGSQPN